MGWRTCFWRIAAAALGPAALWASPFWSCPRPHHGDKTALLWLSRLAASFRCLVASWDCACPATQVERVVGRAVRSRFHSIRYWSCRELATKQMGCSRRSVNLVSARARQSPVCNPFFGIGVWHLIRSVVRILLQPMGILLYRTYRRYVWTWLLVNAVTPHALTFVGADTWRSSVKGQRGIDGPG